MGTKMQSFNFLIFAFLGTFFATVSLAGELPRAKPEAVGLSSERLSKITQVMKDNVAKSEFPGAVLLIARHGKIGYLESFGSLNPDQKTPMSTDAIFRIYSMSKAITTVAAMTLFEEGKFSLDDDVSQYLPQFKDLKVVSDSATATNSGQEKLTTEPTTRPITIQDLMRHTSGLAYGFLYRTPAQKLYAHANLWDDQATNAEFVDRISKLPLAHQPGQTWEYSYSTDVLGRLIEVISGKTLGEFEKERILDPLGMNDTSFFVSDKEKQLRIAEPFKNDNKFGSGEGVIEFFDPRVPKKWESGGAGMMSTALDYARFLQMLLNGGTLDGHRILGPKTVAYMTADHLGTEIRRPFPGYGWSLGFPVRRDAGVASLQGSIGDYFWFGAGGTSFFVDPKEDMLVVFMAYKPSKMEYYQSLLRQMVYASILK